MMTHRSAYVALSLLALLGSAGTGFAQEGQAWGDIHLRTMDGAVYDFHPAGEFVASRSTAGDLEVQLRLEQAGFPGHVSVATAVAVLVDSTRASVALGRDFTLFVDEQPTDLAHGDSLGLVDGGRIERSKKGYEIYWADGSLLSLKVRKSHINAFFRPAQSRRDTLTGLFGNFNGLSGDDVDATTATMSSASMAGLDPRLTEAARALFADGDAPWLLPQAESLFDYEPGQTTWTFRKPPPTKAASSTSLSKSRRRAAKETCEEAGVTDPEILEACIVDVGYTRDESFAETAVAVQERGVENWDADLPRQADAGY